MRSTLVLVADQAEATLYRLEGTRLHPKLAPVDHFEHPQAREHEQDAVAAGHAGLGDNKGHDAEEERRFVRQLIDHLRVEHSRGSYAELYVAAPANFVGRLRKNYTRAVARSVRKEIIGDYTRQDHRGLEARVARWLN